MSLVERDPALLSGPTRPRWRYGTTPLWVVCGQLGVILAITLGFGAIELTRPKVLIAAMFVTTAGMLLLGPPRNIERVVVTVPVVLYLGWWAVSYLWSYNVWIFVRDTQFMLPVAAAMVVIVSLLPHRDLSRAIVTACYVAIAWTLVQLVLNPGEAMSHPDGAPGWRGAFEHKNAMAPFMLLAILAFATLETRTTLRRAGIAVAAFLIIMSQSTTSLMVGAMLIAVAWFLRRVSAAPPRARGPMLAAGSIGGLAAATAALVYLPRLVEAAGKDPTLTSRTDIWAGVIEAIQHRPLTGYGIGGVWVHHAAEPTSTILRDLGFIVYHSHNGFLEVTLQLGLIGLALFAFLLVRVVSTGWRLMATDAAIGRFAVLYGALVVLISITEVATFGLWLVLLCGLSSLVARRRLEEARCAS